MNKVTEKHLHSIIAREQYHQFPDTTLTVCVLELVNGFTVLGQSACVDPAEFDAGFGRTVAAEDAFDKLWQLEGYLLQQRRYEQPLVDLLGEALSRIMLVSSIEEIDVMEPAIRESDAPWENKVAALNALKALRAAKENQNGA